MSWRNQRETGKREPPSPEEARKKQLAAETDFFSWIRGLTTTLAALVVVFTCCFMVMLVSGSSMAPTLHDGDIMLINRLASAPQQGDIVVLRKDAFLEEAIVKRCIAVAGQEVEIDYDANLVYVDGAALEEDYLNFDNVGYEEYGSDYMVEKPNMVYSHFVVPEGCIFVMGDNRNGSSDSRTASLGMVDTRYVIGKVMLMVRPFQALEVF